MWERSVVIANSLSLQLEEKLWNNSKRRSGGALREATVTTLSSSNLSI